MRALFGPPLSLSLGGNHQMPLNHTSAYAELTDEQYGLIGRLVIEWSNIEFLLGLLLSRLLLTPEFLGRVYSDEMSASRLHNALRKAVEIHRVRYRTKLVPAETLDEIVKINSDVEKYRSLRNKFSHYCWMRANDDEVFGTGLSGSVPSSKREDSITLTVAELRGIYEHAYRLVDRLSAAIQKVAETDEDESIKTTLEKSTE